MYKLLTILTITIIFSNTAVAEVTKSVGDINKGKALSVTCIGCHGVDGNSPSNAFPKIAGQHSSYIVKQLQDFKSNKRQNGIMFGMVAALSEQDMLDLAQFYAAQTIKPNVAVGDKKLIALGKRLYRGGNHKNGTPACSSCHAPDGYGIKSAKFPVLAAQYASYTTAQLKAFRQYSINNKLSDDKKAYRGNDINNTMRQATAELSDVDIRALSQYIAGL